MYLKLLSSTILGLSVLLAQAGNGCDEAKPEATSGVSKVTTSVPTGADGMTMEQRNIRDRLLMDNKPGSIKHLYVISPISGQVLLYSTVRGKVTSSGKRLTPTSANYVSNNGNGSSGFYVNTPSGGFYSNEVLQDDGAYGASSEYLFWWDVQGRYHQIYPGSVFIELSDQPLPVKSIVINLEQQPIEPTGR